MIARDDADGIADDLDWKKIDVSKGEPDVLCCCVERTQTAE
jgi:hypothetical protein